MSRFQVEIHVNPAELFAFRIKGQGTRAHLARAAGYAALCSKPNRAYVTTGRALESNEVYIYAEGKTNGRVKLCGLCVSRLKEAKAAHHTIWVQEVPV